MVLANSMYVLCVGCAVARICQPLTKSTPPPTHIECSLSGRHALQYEMGWRRLEDVAGRVASRAVLAQAGDYLKAAARCEEKTRRCCACCRTHTSDTYMNVRVVQ
jgi:hypothetical protein